MEFPPTFNVWKGSQHQVSNTLSRIFSSTLVDLLENSEDTEVWTSIVAHQGNFHQTSWFASTRYIGIQNIQIFFKRWSSEPTGFEPLDSERLTTKVISRVRYHHLWVHCGVRKTWKDQDSYWLKMILKILICIISCKLYNTSWLSNQTLRFSMSLEDITIWTGIGADRFTSRTYEEYCG